jgi:restriction system protein
MVKSLIISILTSKFGQWIIQRMMSSAIFVAAFMWGLSKLHVKFHFVLNQDVSAAVLILVLSSIWTFNVFKIGNFILKYSSLAIAFFAGVAAVLIKFKVPHPPSQLMVFSSVFGLAFLFAFYRLFNVRHKAFKHFSLKEIDAMGNGDTYEKGRQFEEYVANLYIQLGFNAVTTTTLRKQGKLPGAIQKRGGSGEQGVDVCYYDHNTNENVIVQCKHYSSKISNSAVQEIVAAMPLYNATRGIVITNQYFTDPAKELALYNNVILIDRDELAKMIETVSKIKKNKKAA